MPRRLDTARRPIRRRGALALLVGGVLLLVALFLPWKTGSIPGNAFDYLPGIAVLWTVVSLWSLGLALRRVYAEEPVGSTPLSVLAFLGLIADLLIIFTEFGSTVGGGLGGGSSLALVGLVATLIGIWQVEPASTETPPAG